MHQILCRLSEQVVGRRLRQKELSGTTVKIKLRWTDFTTLTRQVTLNQPTNLDSKIYAAVAQLFEKSWSPGKRVRLVGVGVSSFETAAYQLVCRMLIPNQTTACKPLWMNCVIVSATGPSSGLAG